METHKKMRNWNMKCLHAIANGKGGCHQALQPSMSGILNLPNFNGCSTFSRSLSDNWGAARSEKICFAEVHGIPAAMVLQTAASRLHVRTYFLI
jgi:hypothetical protein